MTTRDRRFDLGGFRYNLAELLQLMAAQVITKKELREVLGLESDDGRNGR